MAEKIKIIKNGITAPKGFTANGVNCGFKKKKLDLGVVFSDKPCICAGSFTKNVFKSPSVLYSASAIKNKIQAIVVNSKIANACTGALGYKDAVQTAGTASQLLNIKQDAVLVFSTGVIGQYLDMNKMESGLKKLIPKLGRNGYDNMAKAILTTDTVKKEIAVEFSIKGKKIRIGAIAKGAGMLAPNLATMLSFITSDIDISKKVLNKVFKKCVEMTFNRITVDGDMSTNDSVVMMCNGRAGNTTITEKDRKEISIFKEQLFYVMKTIAKGLVLDGEGATKLIKINVLNAEKEKDALDIGFRIANSPLVKTAFYGADANWGRVVVAAGSSGVKFNADNVEIKFGSYLLFKKGIPVKFSESVLKKYLQKKEVELSFDMKSGSKNIVIYTSDLTEKYIKINAHYRT